MIFWDRGMEYGLQINLQLCPILLEHLFLLVFISLVQDVPIVIHKLGQHQLKGLINDNLLHGRDDLIELKVLGRRRGV